MAEYRLTTIEDNFWREVRIHCIRSSVTMRGFILAAIAEKMQRETGKDFNGMAQPDNT